MDAARIAALLEPFLDRPLSPAQLDQISTYIDLLLRWNARINLTAIRDPEQIVPRHFGESLFMARHLFPDPDITPSEGSSKLDGSKLDGSMREARSSKPMRVVDLGSGAGFPALPIKIWAPEIQLTMIESNHKKAAFLREATRALTLTNVEVIAERAESVAGLIRSTAGDNEQTAFQPAEVVTFRAVENFNQILPLATRFLSPGARLAVLITEVQLDRLQAVPTITWTIIHVPQSHHKLLAIGTSKVAIDRQ
jgi:16S rRNA (guanine527-N7)-methyltransferase